MTNFEYLNSLGEKGLAELLAGCSDCNLCSKSRVKNCAHCYTEWLRWLQDDYNEEEVDVLMAEN